MFNDNPKQMKTTIFLVVNSGGSVKVYKTAPPLKWDEISIMQTIELPDMLFKKPQLQAQLIIPADSVEPKIITADIQNSILNAIKDISGMEVRITFPEIDNDIL